MILALRSGRPWPITATYTYVPIYPTKYVRSRLLRAGSGVREDRGVNQNFESSSTQKSEILAGHRSKR